MKFKNKIGQINQGLSLFDCYAKNKEGVYFIKNNFKKFVKENGGMGFLYGLFRADPWSQRYQKNGIQDKDIIKVRNMFQKYIIDNFGIPALFSENAPHGQQGLNAVIFPTNLLVGSTWDPNLYKELMELLSDEMTMKGINLLLNSALDIIDDYRWGRSEECFSECEILASHFTNALLDGVQKRNRNVAVVLKHFFAQGSSGMGYNGGSVSIGNRELYSRHLYGIKNAMSHEPLALMATYSNVDGLYCHINKEILVNYLRKELGFKGIVMSDGSAVDGMINLENYPSLAGALSINSGVDVDLRNETFKLSNLSISKKEGLLNMKAIDKANFNIQYIKNRLDIMKNPYNLEIDFHKLNELRKKQIKKSIKLAEEGIVLLKNNGILPLKSTENVFVAGPNANNVYNQIGDYSPELLKDQYITPLHALRNYSTSKVEYSQGCWISKHDSKMLEEVNIKSLSSKVVIAFIGGSSSRFIKTNFNKTGSAIPEINSEMDCGEGIDIANINISEPQIKLLKTLKKQGKKIIAVLIQGRPYALGDIVDFCDAIVSAWYPGAYGGEAIARIIYGKANPSGKLPVSIQKSPLFPRNIYSRYDYGQYKDIDSKALFSFGYGLSYSKIIYKSMKVIQEKNGFKINVVISNNSSIPCKEVVMIFGHQKSNKFILPINHLKVFKKVAVKPKEKLTIKFFVSNEILKIIDTDKKWKKIPGTIAFSTRHDFLFKTKEMKIFS